MIEDTFRLASVRARRETFSLAKPFVISRARADTTDVLVVEVGDGRGFRGLRLQERLLRCHRGLHLNASAR